MIKMERLADENWGLFRSVLLVCGKTLSQIKAFLYIRSIEVNNGLDFLNGL